MVDAWTWTAGQLVALAAAVQAAVLLVGLGYAARQLREARRAREETIRPFVVIDCVADRPPIFDLTVTNVGPVMANNVRFQFDPPLASSINSVAALQMFTTGIEQLPPGKVFRTVFDSALQRWNESDSNAKPGYPDRHDVTLRYTSALDGREFTEHGTVDTGVYRNTETVSRKDLHDLAKELEKLVKVVGGWSSRMPGGVRIVTGQEQQRAVRARRREIEQRHHDAE